MMITNPIVIIICEEMLEKEEEIPEKETEPAIN